MRAPLSSCRPRKPRSATKPLLGMRAELHFDPGAVSGLTGLHQVQRVAGCHAAPGRDVDPVLAVQGVAPVKPEVHVGRSTRIGSARETSPAPSMLVMPSDRPRADRRGGSHDMSMREVRDDPSMLSKRGSDEAETSICIGRVRSCAADADEAKEAGGSSSCATAISAGSNSMSATAAAHRATGTDARATDPVRGDRVHDTPPTLAFSLGWP